MEAMLKYLPLVWAALVRRKLRTVLTLLSVMAAFTLFGVMMSTDAGFQRAVEVINRAVVVTGARFADSLTDGIGQQMAAMPNVAAVSPGGNVFGYYRDPKMRAGLMMVGDEAGWPNLPLSHAQWAAWRIRPDGAFISRVTAAQWGVKKGDVFTIVDNNTPRAVMARRREIATMRALGFGAAPVGMAVAVEGILLALAGVGLGAIIAYGLFNGAQNVSNNIAFHLTVSPAMIALGLAWAFCIGLLGGVLPAIHAARLPVADGLRAS